MSQTRRGFLKVLSMVATLFSPISALMKKEPEYKDWRVAERIGQTMRGICVESGINVQLIDACSGIQVDDRQFIVNVEKYRSWWSFKTVGDGCGIMLPPFESVDDEVILTGTKERKAIDGASVELVYESGEFTGVPPELSNMYCMKMIHRTLIPFIKSSSIDWSSIS